MTQTASAPLEGKSLEPLIDAIRGMVAETGSIPSERVIAEQLRVKRHRLRRALEALRAKGELEPSRIGRRPASEIRVGGDLAVDTNPIEIIELRTVLEPALARFAAVRASPAEIERIGRAAQTPPGAEPGSIDLAFHRAVASGSRNSLAAEVYALLRHVATDARLRFGDTDERRRCPNRIAERDAEHQAIARAIAARDPDAAEQAMRDHLGAVQRQILGRLGPPFRTR
ncbi:MAG TPA: FCD domain-containing protein [Lichenihabitans sp.]|jgi:DNA-binding FadR family transcriptional regulator|nr:FCD domain-containing protein [Lichenihabitans sp.]